MITGGNSSGPANRRHTGFLITGGAGFIGSNLADRLLRDGSHVVVFDDLTTRQPPERRMAARALRPRSADDPRRGTFATPSSSEPLSTAPRSSSISLDRPR